jgi:hypothetical protein
VRPSLRLAALLLALATPAGGRAQTSGAAPSPTAAASGDAQTASPPAGAAAAPGAPAAVPTGPQYERDEVAPLAGYTGGAAFIRSRDSNFVLYPNGRVNLDGYFYLNRGNPPADSVENGVNDQRPRHTFFIRRARAELNGTILKRFDFMIAGEFASIPILFQQAAITDAFVNANFTPWANVMIGQFDAPFTLENRTVDKYLDFMERSVTVRGFAVPSNKEIGLMLHGLAPSRFLRYELGVFNGDGGNVRNPDSQFDFIGRAYFAPLALLQAAKTTRWLSDIWVGGSVWWGRRIDVPYDAFPIGTAGAVTIMPPVYGSGYRYVPNGDLLKWAIEVNAPIGPLGFRFELVRNVHEGYGIYRAAVTDAEKALPLQRVLSGNITRSGTSFYVQAWYWILGSSQMLPTPGQEIPMRWQGYRKDKQLFPVGLYLTARYERMVMHQGEVQDANLVLSDAQRTALGTVTFDSFGLGLNLWISRHFRFSTNYFINYLDGDMPLVKGDVRFPPAGPLMQPTYPFFRTAQHELLFRAAIAL